jgi:enoyl-CoA hydratase/carnithine racemase
MYYKTIKIEKMESLAIVTMNRPKEMNAISREMRREIIDAFSSFEKDGSVNIVILTGGQFVFSAGADIKEIAVLCDCEVEDYITSIKQCLLSIYMFNKPVIAAVCGIAMGEGLNLMNVCDFAIASESAIFSHPEVRLLGVNPFFQFLRDIVGTMKAKELTMLGEPIGAMEALHIGLVTKTVAIQDHMEEAIRMARELSKRPTNVLQALKRTANLTSSMDKISALELELATCKLLFKQKDRNDIIKIFQERIKRNN